MPTSPRVPRGFAATAPHVEAPHAEALSVEAPSVEGAELLAVLAAERSIRGRLQEFCRGVDRCDVELLRGVFHDGATVDYGVFVGGGHEFAGFVIPRVARMVATMHSIGETVFDWVDPAAVRTETYVYAQHLRNDSEGQFLELFGGRYVDRFTLVDRTWRIAERRFLLHWDTRQRQVPAIPGGAFPVGTRDRWDPSYG